MVIHAEIKPDAFYDDDGVIALLNLPLAKVSKERNSGRLKSSKRAGRYFYRGSWLLAWLDPPTEETAK